MTCRSNSWIIKTIYRNNSNKSINVSYQLHEVALDETKIKMKIWVSMKVRVTYTSYLLSEDVK